MALPQAPLFKETVHVSFKCGRVSCIFNHALIRVSSSIAIIFFSFRLYQSSYNRETPEKMGHLADLASDCESDLNGETTHRILRLKKTRFD